MSELGSRVQQATRDLLGLPASQDGKAGETHQSICRRLLQADFDPGLLEISAIDRVAGRSDKNCVADHQFDQGLAEALVASFVRDFFFLEPVQRRKVWQELRTHLEHIPPVAWRLNVLEKGLDFAPVALRKVNVEEGDNLVTIDEISRCFLLPPQEAAEHLRRKVFVQQKKRADGNVIWGDWQSIAEAAPGLLPLMSVHRLFANDPENLRQPVRATASAPRVSFTVTQASAALRAKLDGDTWTFENKPAQASSFSAVDAVRKLVITLFVIIVIAAIYAASIQRFGSVPAPVRPRFFVPGLIVNDVRQGRLRDAGLGALLAQRRSGSEVSRLNFAVSSDPGQ